MRSRQVIWRRGEPGESLELMTLLHGSHGIELSGSIVAAEQGKPLRIDYHIVADGDWVTREARVKQEWDGRSGELVLRHDGAGGWERDGRAEPALSGCRDVDLAFTPATNALPVNRLNLAIGASAELKAAWIRFPSLATQVLEQRYRRTGPDSFVYESIASGFSAELLVDADGLPVRYGDLWTRIAAS